MPRDFNDFHDDDDERPKERPPKRARKRVQMNDDDVVHSTSLNAGTKRKYYFDIRRTREQDFFLTITESTRTDAKKGGRRNKLYIYKEDMGRFLNHLDEMVDYMKTELLPDYNFSALEKTTDEERELLDKLRNDEPNTKNDWS